MSAQGRMSSARRKYALLAGSELLRATYWARAAQNELKGLIKRFATREDNCRRKGAPTFRWRKHRLEAVSIYETRFERVPDVFRSHRLPRMASYYVHEGKYIWPERGEPGRPVNWKVSR